MTFPICQNCQKDMRVHKNGAYVARYINGNVVSVRSGDIFACPSCGNKVVVNMTDPVNATSEMFEGEVTRAIKNHWTVHVGKDDV